MKINRGMRNVGHTSLMGGNTNGTDIGDHMPDLSPHAPFQYVIRRHIFALASPPGVSE